MIQSVAFASCYVYSPGGTSTTCERSRLLRTLIKEGNARFMSKYALRLRQQLAEAAPLAGFLGSGHVWVPIPGCTPTSPANSSVPDRLAAALVEAGLGRDVWCGLRRMRPVHKSATAAPGARPTVAAHYDSFAVTGPAPPRPLVLLDDVVTKGRTLFAAAARLQEAFPNSEVRAFALLRTMGFIDSLEHLVDPCIGLIRWRAGDAHRTP